MNESLANINVIRKHKSQATGVRHRTETIFKVTRGRGIPLLHVLALYDKTDLAALEGSIFPRNLVSFPKQHDTTKMQSGTSILEKQVKN